MKKQLFFFLIIFLIQPTLAICQNNNDTTKNESISQAESKSSKVDTNKKKAKPTKQDSTLKSIISDTSNIVRKKLDSLYQESPCTINCFNRSLNTTQWWLVFLPSGIVLFFALLLMVNLWSKDEFSITKLLRIDKNNGEAENLSSSRFIALLTGIAAVFIGTTMTMYYGYALVAECNKTHSVDDLYKILIGLGIGVIPYGINVWNRNNREENQPNNTNPSNPTTPQQTSPTNPEEL